MEDVGLSTSQVSEFQKVSWRIPLVQLLNDGPGVGISRECWIRGEVYNRLEWERRRELNVASASLRKNIQVEKLKRQREPLEQLSQS